MGQSRVRPALPDERRRNVEVVVLEEHRRSGLLRELVEHGVGEAGVDCSVAVLPRPAEVRLGIRLVLPQAVLHEPECGIGDDLVEEPVRLLVVGDEPEPNAAGRRLLLERPGGGDVAFLGRHRARDPGHVIAGAERPQRRDEPSRAAVRDTATPRIAVVSDRPAVGDDDEAAPHEG